MTVKFSRLVVLMFVALCAAPSVRAGEFRRELSVATGSTVEIVNRFGRVDVSVAESADGAETVAKNLLTATSEDSVAEIEIKIGTSKNGTLIEIAPNNLTKRIDVALILPARINVKIQTNEGEILVGGDFASVEARSETGTIATDVPLDDLKYNFVWTASRPRFVSDVELADVKEKAAGKFVISGRINKQTPKSKFGQTRRPDREDSEEEAETPKPDGVRKDRKKSSGANTLNFSTARGIVLLNVSPNEVPSDLRERALTKAAKAIVRSGDSLLVEAIRRASPKYFGEYAATLPPVKFEPELTVRSTRPANVNSQRKKVLVRVTDLNNRAVYDLKKEDFQILERGTEREIVSVEPASAPFNLVLLLDVSGSVEYYVDFIRKAARAFVQTAAPGDRIAIIIFNEDVKQISTFSSDKGTLSESLDTFDAGGGTAYYDSLAFVLAETLRPLRGERSAIVVLTDGDDNRSFLPFDALLGSIQESGALIYPLYVPSALIAASNADLNAQIDPLRAKYMGLTTKAEGEGERLAKVSGGVYYPITQLNQIQKAYDDIVLQLRTAYSVTFKSDVVETSDRTMASPRLKVKVKRENAFVKLGSVVEVK